jgi:hypothetical protein
MYYLAPDGIYRYEDGVTTKVSTDADTAEHYYWRNVVAAAYSARVARRRFRTFLANLGIGFALLLALAAASWLVVR